ncbi:MAG: M15 family metallopeptidase [Cyclobacteriaceae bacterium]|nr:M15 family metallopeptidase [Cyclobacteriaceae bacterium]MDW8330011.1 M15 family metallopeptidase [Cyclobacteriaceae bacterium]
MFRLLVIAWMIIIRVPQRDQKPTEKDYLLGRFDPSADARFVKPDDQYTTGAARSQYLRKETYAAFVSMAEAAKKDGVQLVIVSATRNFETQKIIWERKWNDESAIRNPADRARKILQYSSMPGTSRHHWGTDLDLNSLNNEYFASGEGRKVYQWLTTHAAQFGFCQPYTSKSTGRTGYEEEKWHWSYTPLSRPFLCEYEALIQIPDITGFAGSETAAELDVITNYVAGVACR